MEDQVSNQSASNILDGQVIYVKKGRLNKFGFEPAWNSYFDFYLSTKYFKKPLLQLQDVTFHLFLRKNLNDDDPSWQMPSMRMIKRQFDISQDKIEGMLSRLTKAHLLKKVSGQGEGQKGANVANTYILSDPIQNLEDFLTVARNGDFDQQLKEKWQVAEDPVPKIGTPPVPKIGKAPVPKTGTHKHTSSFKQTTTETDKENNSSGTENRDVVVALTRLGITEKVAQRLASRHKAATIFKQIDYHEYDLTTKPEKIKSPSGLLRRRIEEDWAPPDGYTPDWRDRLKAEHEARELEALEKQALEAARIAEESREREKREKIREEHLAPLKRHYSTSEREESIWRRAKEHLKTTTPAALAVFGNSELLSLQDNKAVIWLASQYHRDQAEERYRFALQRLLAKELHIEPAQLEIKWEVPQSGSQPPP